MWRISALKVYLKLNQKVPITLSTHGKPNSNMQKNLVKLSYIYFRAEILQIFELLIWKIDDFINSFWLCLTFRYVTTANLNSAKYLITSYWFFKFRSFDLVSFHFSSAETENTMRYLAKEFCLLFEIWIKQIWVPALTKFV